VSELVGQVLGLDDRLDSVMANYRALNITFGNVDPIPQTTPSRRIEAANQAAIAALIGNTATIEAARLVAGQAAVIGVSSNALSPFDSADDAYTVRDELVRALEAIALTATDALYVAVVELQSTLVAHIEAHGQSLPRISHVSYRVALPMLAIAHRLYGAAELAVRDADLTARNRIAAPLFVAAGTRLEALNG
jgi:prophage DNA circulation protein